MGEMLARPSIDLHRPGGLDQLTDALRAQGLAVFTGVADRAEALQLARSLIMVRRHRDGDLDGVTTIAQRADVAQRPGFAGFSDRKLLPHTEGTTLPRPPGALILICARAAHAGGDSVLVDGREVYDEIARSDPAMLQVLCEPRSAYFGGGHGHLGSIFTPARDGRVTLRLRLDHLARLSPAAPPTQIGSGRSSTATRRCSGPPRARVSP